MCIGRGPGGSSAPPEPRICVSPHAHRLLGVGAAPTTAGRGTSGGGGSSAASEAAAPPSRGAWGTRHCMHWPI